MRAPNQTTPTHKHATRIHLRVKYMTTLDDILPRRNQFRIFYGTLDVLQLHRTMKSTIADTDTAVLQKCHVVVCDETLRIQRTFRTRRSEHYKPSDITQTITRDKIIDNTGARHDMRRVQGDKAGKRAITVVNDGTALDHNVVARNILILIGDVDPCVVVLFQIHVQKLQDTTLVRIPEQAARPRAF